jgi:hypothetical protein
MRNLTSNAVFIIVAAVALTVVAAGVLTFEHRITNHVTLKAIGIGVYSDPQCTVCLTSLEWGLLDKGGTYFKTAYCKNTQNVPVTLTLAAVDFDPASTEPYITSSWNYSGQVLNPDQVIPVQFSLSIAVDFPYSGSFSFTSVVTAVEKTS